MYFLTFRNKQAAEYQIIRRKYTINEKILRIFKYSIYAINPQERYNQKNTSALYLLKNKTHF